jgi:DNA (cytosine-5)-methyltransferase 1
LIASPGLLPRSSIWSAIGLIPDDAQDHDIEAGFARWELAHRADYNGYAPAKTITCGGGEYNYHPTGKRPFTAREFACLQTFPMDFEFSDHNVRKQIGNAVPPLFAKAIYAEIAQCLRESDAKEANGVYH